MIADSSDGHCLLAVMLDDQGKGTRLIHTKSSEFCWKVSRVSAQHFRALLSGLLKSEGPAHQYLDSDDRSSPPVIVSRGEYEVDTIRRWLRS